MAANGNLIHWSQMIWIWHISSFNIYRHTCYWLMCCICLTADRDLFWQNGLTRLKFDVCVFVWCGYTRSRDGRCDAFWSIEEQMTIRTPYWTINGERKRNIECVGVGKSTSCQAFYSREHDDWENDDWFFCPQCTGMIYFLYLIFFSHD